MSTFEVPREFARIDDPAAAAAAARQAGKMVVWVPRSVRSKEKLLGVLSQDLHFPNYFGWNWDALEECLQDLSWLPENAQIAIVHERLPFGAGDNRQIYCDILRGGMQRTDGRQLEVAIGS